MKNLFYLIAFVFLFSTISAEAVASNSEADSTSTENVGTSISPDMISVHPQPFRVGDARVSITLPEKIKSTSIYSVTGEKVVHQVHRGSQEVQKVIPVGLQQGEYILKLETDAGVGIKRIFLQ